MSILGHQVAVNNWSACLLFFLGNGAKARQGVAVADRRAKTDGENLQPPTRKPGLEHTDEKCRAQRSRNDGMLKAPLLGDLLAHEALIDHLDLFPVPQNLVNGWRVGERSDFVADLDIGERYVARLIHSLLGLRKTYAVKRKYVKRKWGRGVVTFYALRLTR